MVSSPQQRRDALRQALQRAHRGVVAADDQAGRDQVAQRRDQQRGQRLHPRGIGLQRQRVAVAVDDQAGQAIGLGMDQAVVGRVVELLPQRQRGAEPALRPVQVEHRAGVAVQPPGGDQAVRVEAPGAVVPAVVALQPHRAAGRQGAGRRGHGDLVREGPGVAGLHPLVVARQQAEQRVGCGGLGHAAAIGAAFRGADAQGGAATDGL